MMKYVQSVALFLLMMVMMMTMMASVSAGPLRPSLNHSRHDDEETASLENKEENSNRLESRQDVNNTLDNITGNVTSNSSMSDTPSVFALPLDTQLEETLQELDKTEDDSTQTRKDLYLTQSGSTAIVGYAAPPVCQLSICALMNLSHELQSGGDQRAGRSSSDPFGHGK
ncbi:uncharacterized protein [Trachinotus anak]|uniref:uncharacterized protein isoform X2 n=1 Tax=Trachinotus anak TaxID=443729 RepID=UPI0039F21E67